MGQEAIRDEEGNIVGYLSFHWEICEECGGEGKHPNRNIDGNGITQSELDEMDFDDRVEFMDNYMSGRYDVTCQRCHDGKVKVYDQPPKNAHEAVQEAYEERSGEEEDRGRSWRDDPEAVAERRYCGEF